MTYIKSPSLGEAWLETSRRIRQEGMLEKDGAEDIKELAHVVLEIDDPDPDDPVIKAHGDPKHLAWMMSNFFDQKDVPELGNAKSYAVRLFNYQGQGLDQVAKVTEKLRKKPESKSATLTTLMPLVDTSYIPCVSLLDFWVRGGTLECIVYARSLDFGKKAYGNLVALAMIQSRIAMAIQATRGKMYLHVKSAHFYIADEPDLPQAVKNL